MILIIIGVVTIIDLVGILPVSPSAYFAAVLTTIALGLLIGAWFGRARWLIALGLVTSFTLGVTTLTESVDRVRSTAESVVWTPTSYAALDKRYQSNFGDGTLDLRQVDFTGREAEIAVEVNFGALRVILPPNVDVTVLAKINAGDASMFGTQWSGFSRPARDVTDLGPDGEGGGTLRLDLHVNAGSAEVTR